jgi:TldD protein
MQSSTSAFTRICRLFGCIFIFFVAHCHVSFAQQPTSQQSVSDTKILQAMKAEMQRTMTDLKSEPNPPYFVSYAITETQFVSMTASFGNIVIEDSNRIRTLDVEVRVGSYDLDNKRQIRGTNFEMGGFFRGTPIPLDDDVNAIRTAIWATTDRQYKASAERYLKVVSNRAVKVKEEDSSGDFSPYAPRQC